MNQEVTSIVGCENGHDFLGFTPLDGSYFTESDDLASKLRSQGHEVSKSRTGHWNVIMNPSAITSSIITTGEKDRSKDEINAEDNFVSNPLWPFLDPEFVQELIVCDLGHYARVNITPEEADNIIKKTETRKKLWEISLRKERADIQNTLLDLGATEEQMSDWCS